MRHGRRVRRLAFALLVLLTAAQGVWMAFTAMASVPLSVDEPPLTSRLIERFQPARAALAGLERAGYLDREEGGSPPADHIAFCLARLAVAPTWLIPSADEPVVLTNLPDDAAVDRLVARGEFRLRQRIGAGVAVLERVPP